jgi:methanogenic corrinoid protein MtbC1
MPDYALMNQCLYEGKAREGEQMTRDALAGGRSAQEILRDGLIAGMSALLTTTMTYMKVVIDGFQQQGQGHIKMAIGGAPISQMFADEVGADGYGADASAP